MGNTKIASPSSAAKGVTASFCAEAAAAGLPAHLVRSSGKGFISSPSLAVQNGNSPVDFVHAGNFARETLEGKLTGV